MSDRLFKMKNTIDDSPRVVARDFIKKYRSKPVAKTQDVKVGVKSNGEVGVVKAKAPKSGSSKRDQAWKLFAEGYGANEVAAHMEITYANSHYYLRAMRKAGGDIGKEVK